MQPIPLPAAALPFADAAVHPAMPWEDNETWEGLRELELSRAQALAAVVATSQSTGRAWLDEPLELGSHFLQAPASMQPLSLPATALPISDAAVHPTAPPLPPAAALPEAHRVAAAVLPDLAAVLPDLAAGAVRCCLKGKQPCPVAFAKPQPKPNPAEQAFAAECWSDLLMLGEDARRQHVHGVHVCTKNPNDVRPGAFTRSSFFDDLCKCYKAAYPQAGPRHGSILLLG